jgi:hypothetical protein
MPERLKKEKRHIATGPFPQNFLARNQGIKTTIENRAALEAAFHAPDYNSSPPFHIKKYFFPVHLSSLQITGMGMEEDLQNKRGNREKYLFFKL